MGRLAVLQESTIFSLVHARAAMQVGHRNTRIHSVDSDSLGRELQRRATRELLHGRLAHTVGQNTGERAQAVHAAHIHDVALAFLEVRNCELHQPENGIQVYVHHLAPCGEGGVFDRAGGDNSRTVYQDIQSAEALNGRLDHLLAVRFDAQVCCQRYGLSAGYLDVLRRLREFFESPSHDSNFGAIRSHSYGRGASDSAACPSDERDLALQHLPSSLLSKIPSYSIIE